MRRRRLLGANFTPLSLFANGELGVWYDPSDFSTLYQDSAGTTAVTAVEQPVGKMLDKSGNAKHASQSTNNSRPTLRARYNILVDTETLATQSVTTLAASYKLTFTGAGSITLSGTATGTYSAGTNVFTCTAGTLTLTVSGTVTKADLRPSNTSTAFPNYQRVTTSTDYDTVGFYPYLDFDGSDDSLTTATIDFSTVDSVSIAAGIVSSGGSTNIDPIFASGSGVANTFYLSIRLSNRVRMTSRGSIGVSAETAVGTIVTGKHHVICGLTDVSADINRARSNKAQTSVTTDQGTGNYSSLACGIGYYDTNLGRFKGRLYGLLVVNKLITDAQLGNLETWMNTKTVAF